MAASLVVRKVDNQVEAGVYPLQLQYQRSEMRPQFATVATNTAIAGARDPGSMAEAMKLAVRAGRLAYHSGRIPKKLYATASSPVSGVVR